MSDARSLEKYEFAKKLLENHSIRLYIDATHEDVYCPIKYKVEKNTSLVLEIGYTLTPIIPDLLVDEVGFIGTLSFAGRPFTCSAPWEAIYMIFEKNSNIQRVWAIDMPPELLEQLNNNPEPEIKSKKQMPSYLRLVK